MTKVIVTGGAGFIGSHITDLLIEEGFEVTVIDNLSTGKKENLNPHVNFAEGDITDREFILETFQTVKPEFVIHHAAQIDVQKSIKDPVLDSSVNIIGTINILDACVATKVKKIIYASSAALYGTPVELPITENHPVQPESFYGISKHTPEHFFPVYESIHGLDYTVLRYSNVYGPKQDAKGEGGVVAIFTDRIYENNISKIFGDGEQTRDFVYVKDVARANYTALHKGSKKIMNVSSNSIITVTDLYRIIADLFESKLEPQYEEARKGDIVHSRLDNSLVKEVMGWEPKYSLEEGLSETVNWRKNL